ncbi:MAG: tRNA pseudouridine(65) synthase TruC [Saprospiraceae bacterium]
MVINKPHGLLVHRSRIARDADVFALQLLRDQIGQKVYLAHRLDRKTSGLLLFAKSPEVNRYLQAQFREQQVEKVYHAIVRGFIDAQGEIDYPLTNEGKTQDAQTAYHLLEQLEVPVPFGGFKTSRYSLVELKPKHGRFHQLRKHMAHIYHPIIGDRPHGCNKQNRLWKNEFNQTRMLLHAKTLTFELPNQKKLILDANYSPEFAAALEMLRHFPAHNY